MRIRALLAAVVGMGVLIVVGIAVLAVTVVRRLGAPAAAPIALVLEEPAGTRMQALAPAGDRLAVLLQGGGADRVLLLDPRSGQVTGRVALAR